MSVVLVFVTGGGGGEGIAHLYADGRAKGNFEPPLGALGEADLGWRGGGKLAVPGGLGEV